MCSLFLAAQAFNKLVQRANSVATTVATNRNFINVGLNICEKIAASLEGCCFLVEAAVRFVVIDLGFSLVRLPIRFVRALYSNKCKDIQQMDLNHNVC